MNVGRLLLVQSPATISGGRGGRGGVNTIEPKPWDSRDLCEPHWGNNGESLAFCLWAVYLCNIFCKRQPVNILQSSTKGLKGHSEMENRASKGEEKRG